MAGPSQYGTPRRWIKGIDGKYRWAEVPTKAPPALNLNPSQAKFALAVICSNDYSTSHLHVSTAVLTCKKLRGLWSEPQPSPQEMYDLLRNDANFKQQNTASGCHWALGDPRAMCPDGLPARLRNNTDENTGSTGWKSKPETVLVARGNRSYPECACSSLEAHS